VQSCFATHSPTHELSSFVKRIPALPNGPRANSVLLRRNAISLRLRSVMSIMDASVKTPSAVRIGFSPISIGRHLKIIRNLHRMLYAKSLRNQKFQRLAEEFRARIAE
jgi:hypothetical protein